MSEHRGGVEGVEVPNVTRWFEEHVDGVVPPLDFSLIAGGHSNLTFKVTDRRGEAWVLRRPPLHHVLPTAHDMSREHTIISALGPTPVPVAPAVGLCTDDSVNGSSFYVMDFVEGHVLRTSDIAASVFNEEQRRAAGESLVDVMAAIHSVDVDAVGLGDLGRREGYIERQLKRWYSQFEQSKTRELPLLDDVFTTLKARVPTQGAATIVHGDYRLDNTMLGDDGRVKAVLDWELCTLGDPLADVGLLMVYWSEPDDALESLPSSPTMLPGFPSRKEIAQRYADQSGRDVSDLDFYVAFGYWKLACIIEGVYARYVGGAMGTASTGFEHFGNQVVHLVEAAKAAVER
jgi:aminoglycoside phosphotransferase (APT) family kinase protein